MKERPILFSTPMVQAILGGTKTQTRRVVKPTPELVKIEMTDTEGYYLYDKKSRIGYSVEHGDAVEICPYGQIGDVLWVRETWQYSQDELGNNSSTTKGDCFGKFLYKANGDTPDTWKPSIFMPREACRIRLKITDIRVEQLHYISEDDAKAEGSPMYVMGHGVIDNSKLNADPGYSSFINYRMGFEHLWKSINGPESWDLNPFVWVISFEKIPSL